MNRPVTGSVAIAVIVHVLLLSAPTTQAASKAKSDHLTCKNRRSRCFLKRVTCPAECPRVRPKDPKAKACFLDCHSPKCEAVCKTRKPNCNGPGAACYDPRFIGGDGIVFYFHGRRNEHFALMSDSSLQINARFIGLRPEGRTRDYTWIQALGIMFGSHNLSVEAARTEEWDHNLDYLNLSYDGKELVIPQGLSSSWSPNFGDNDLRIERTSIKNGALLVVPELEILVSVVPITEDDNRAHNYQIPSNDSFAHLEVQFRFFGLSEKVEGILGRTYRPDFENPAKAGVAMAVVGGEDKYRTTSLLSADCNYCAFSTEGIPDGNHSAEVDTIDCTGRKSGGSGIVCRK